MKPKITRCEHPGCPKDSTAYVDSKAKVLAYCKEHKTWAYRLLAKLWGWDGAPEGISRQRHRKD